MFREVLFPVFGILRGIKLPVFCAHDLSIEIWIHSADLYILAMSCVRYARARAAKNFWPREKYYLSTKCCLS